MARGAADRGKRVAFGDGHQITWGPHSAEIFDRNPNIAPPGSEGAKDIEWIAHYKGHRLYNWQDGNRWRWHMDFRAKPGQIYFSSEEIAYAKKAGSGYILIEPNLPAFKKHVVNKAWPFDRYEQVAREFVSAGYRVVQFGYRGMKFRLPSAAYIRTPSFRYSLAMLSRARLAVVPEGGMHHGAAAVNVKAVVLFGGFIPPQVTGYDTHANLTGGATHFCGSLLPCDHCKAAMAAIKVDDVLTAADRLLG